MTQKLGGKPPSSQRCFRASFLPTCPLIHSSAQLSIPLFLQPASHSSTTPFIYSPTAYVSTHQLTHPLIYPHLLMQRPTYSSTYTSIYSFISPSIQPLYFHPSTHPPVHPTWGHSWVPKSEQAFSRLSTSTPALRQARLSLDGTFVPVFLPNHLHGQVGVCSEK